MESSSPSTALRKPTWRSRCKQAYDRIHGLLYDAAGVKTAAMTELETKYKALDDATTAAERKEWVILGMDTKTGSSTVDKTLIISKNVLDTNVAKADVTAKLGAYATSLTELQAANGTLLSPDTTATDVGIRVAFWMDSAKVQEMLYPTTVPTPELPLQFSRGRRNSPAPWEVPDKGD